MDFSFGLLLLIVASSCSPVIEKASCPCGRIYMPLCASDGRTYNNMDNTLILFVFSFNSIFMFHNRSRSATAFKIKNKTTFFKRIGLSMYSPI
ncbi:hypothetical protein K1T71_009589 [Dendrolimus kikuchii]|uniref:Uncharacterized protein n=1 Tax=Dendrolimus kikuchii TaxID=765133 RepID=A0ACC1CS61_9NEOP|nr:hypothetical protein K1T71_009589 [Dendrolimus kikuchii]